MNRFDNYAAFISFIRLCFDSHSDHEIEITYRSLVGETLRSLGKEISANGSDKGEWQAWISDVNLGYPPTVSSKLANFSKITIDNLIGGTAATENALGMHFRLLNDPEHSSLAKPIDELLLEKTPNELANHVDGNDTYVPAGKTLPTDACPFPGLGAMQLSDKSFFFGRRSERDRFRLLMQARPLDFFIVSGDSGVGKSSLVFAALLPIVGIETTRGSSDFLRLVAGSQRRGPIYNFAANLTFQLSLGVSPEQLEDRWQNDPGLMAASLQDILSDVRVIVFDQFEEIFTHERNISEIRTIFSAISRLQSANKTATIQPLVFVTVRTEFRNECQRIPELSLALKMQNYIDVFEPTTTDVSEMISSPAALAGIDISAVQNQLVTATCAEAGTLPMLAATLKELWHSARQKSSRKIHAEMLEQIGGIAGAVSKNAEERFQEFSLHISLEDVSYPPKSGH